MSFLGPDNGINVFYIVSQLFALVTMISNLVAMQKRKKVQILKFNTLAAFSAIFHYAFLGAWSGMVIKIVATARDSIAVYEASKNKTSKIIPIIFITFYLVSGIISFESWASLLPMTSAFIYTIAIYTVDASKIRKYALVGAILWLIYDIYVFSIVGIVSETIFILNDLSAIYRFRKKTGKKRRRN